VSLDGAYLFLRVSPSAVPHKPHLGRFTIPFPSHRTFSFPESGGPTVFVTRHAQAIVRTR
jgi:hypothetical protein